MGLNTPIFQTLGCSTPIVYKPCQFALNKPQLGMLETYWITFPNIKLKESLSCTDMQIKTGQC